MIPSAIRHRGDRPLRAALAAVLLLASPALPAVAAEQAPAWVERSDANAQVLLEVMARFAPEGAGQLGVAGLDEEIMDLSPGFDQRAVQALAKAAETLKAHLAAEKDPAVRQDLAILIDAADSAVEGNRLTDKHFLPYFSLSQAIFGGVRGLLDDQVEASRRPAALVRIKKYAGLSPDTPGTRPIATLAEEFVRSRMARPGLLGPVRSQVEKDLVQSKTFLDGLAPMFQKYGIQGYEEPLATLRRQIEGYDEFIRREVLPRAREDFRQPAEVYAFSLKQVGIDMPVEELVSRAQVAFREIQSEMQTLAPLVARQHGISGGMGSTDYRHVLAEIKKKQLVGEAILPHYQQRIKDLEGLIRREGIVTLPDRPMRVRLASEAESAAIPAPNMRAPRLIGNTGEIGEFILPLRIPGQGGKDQLALDDFTHESMSWALTAHEGRPGHELQFAALVEKGVSKARAIFAFNSVNVEGWALYSEAEVKPYLPLDGQFAALQSRLMRAARAFLDPGLQLGTIGRDEALRVLREEVGLSEGMALQEVERYTFRSPGQATAYFCGYTRLMELRAEAERILGPGFDRRRFHDFILSQGLLPPALLRKAVMEELVPTMKAEAAKAGQPGSPS